MRKTFSDNGWLGGGLMFQVVLAIGVSILSCLGMTHSTTAESNFLLAQRMGYGGLTSATVLRSHLHTNVAINIYFKG
jgi:hypothetical protein